MSRSTVRLTIPDDHVAFWEELFPEDFDPLVARLMYAVRALAKQINEAASKWLTQFGVPSAQFNYLVVLQVRGGNLTLNEIATQIHTSNATVATMVAVLERERLVRRDANPRDARSVLVSLTPRGSSLIKKIFPYHHRRLRSIVRGMAKRDQEVLHDLLLRVGQGITDSADDAPVPRAASRRGD
jgi:DNA-binding MarR family transcriptional regulator